MPSEGDADEPATLAPDDAFAVLANDTRVGILRALGEADGPLSFSALRDRVGTSDSGQFNYHLGKLTGHFVRKTDAGYVLRQAGRRVVEAVLSGAVTEVVVVEPTRLDADCPFCGAPVEVRFREERLLVRCTECPGSYVGCESTSRAFRTLPEGTLTLCYLPSAGVQGRSPRELLDAALVWSHTELVSMATGVCSRCAGPVEHAVDVCADHDADGGLCSRCESRYAVVVDAACANCGRTARGAVLFALLASSQFRAFFERRGVDTVAPAWEDAAALYRYEEELLSTEPFEARFAFAAGGDEVTVTVDAELDVVDVDVRAA